MLKPKAVIKFWGVRGSTPVPGRATFRRGGNTSCVELKCAGERIILDAGTGIRELGNSIVQKERGPVSAHILLTHAHWDHFIGLPFFKPLYDKHSRIIIYGPKCGGKKFSTLLNTMFQPPFFPISLKKLQPSVKIVDLSSKNFKIGRFLANMSPMNHPDGSVGFRFKLSDNLSLSYVSDNEPSKGKKFDATVKWLSNSNILIHDSQYSPEEYKKKTGWGHSPFTYPIDLAAAAKIPRLCLYHFDPDHSDKDIGRLKKLATMYARKKNYKLEIIVANEGLELEI